MTAHVKIAAAAKALGFGGQVAAGLEFAGVRVDAVVQPDTQELARRAMAGLGVLDDHYHLVEALAALPLGKPVPWADLDLRSRLELDVAPPGVVQATSTHVERLWRPAVHVVGVLAVTSDWRQGINRVGLLGRHAPGGIALLRPPRLTGPLLARAGRFGLGVVTLDEHGRWELLRPATPIHRIDPGARHWRFLEAALAAWRRTSAPARPAAQQLAARRELANHEVAAAAAALGFQGHLAPEVHDAGTTCTAVAVPDEAELARRAAVGLGALHPSRHYQLFQVLAVLPLGEPVPWADLDPDARAELDVAPPGVVHATSTHVQRLWRPAVRVTGVLTVTDRTRQGLAQVSLFAAQAPRGLAAVRRPRPANLDLAARLGIGVVTLDDHGRWQRLLAPAARHGTTLDGIHWRFLEAVTAALLRQPPHGDPARPPSPDQPPPNRTQPDKGR
jgi:hypothetical protein